jgi:hypothetical protein
MGENTGLQSNKEFSIEESMINDVTSPWVRLGDISVA